MRIEFKPDTEFLEIQDFTEESDVKDFLRYIEGIRVMQIRNSKGSRFFIADITDSVTRLMTRQEIIKEGDIIAKRNTVNDFMVLYERHMPFLEMKGFR